MIHSLTELEHMARDLETSGRYRVLRRLEARSVLTAADGSETRLGMFVDVETTGLDPVHDEIIEIAMVPFTYGLDGRIFDLQTPLHKFRQPDRPIPEEVTALTGISNEMVAGHKADPDEIAAFLEPAAVVLAHNAAFDRRFLERIFTPFAGKPWACSMTQVDWQGEGFDGTKLAYLTQAAGFFYERHRAFHDCIAAIELLARTLPKSGITALASLLNNARRPSVRIWAEGSPFDLKGALKARGYRWNGDAKVHPRCWYIDVDELMRDDELAYLRTEIYRRNVELPMSTITALERFSDRS